MSDEKTSVSEEAALSNEDDGVAQKNESADAGAADPAAAKGAGKSVDGESHPLPPDKARQVLIVEDSVPLRRMLVKIIETNKCIGWEADNGKVALEILRRQGVDFFSLLVCDLMMPIMDGASFIAAAKKEFGEALPPILICSSRSDREAVHIVRKLGINGYILKPFKTATVVDKLVEIFPEISNATQNS